MNTLQLHDVHEPRYRHGSVGEFAQELKKSAEKLMEQLQKAGVEKESPDESLSDAEKHQLLNYLQSSHDDPARKRIVLVRSTGSRTRTKVPTTPKDLILVGGLGHISYIQADEYTRRLIDTYRELVGTFGCRLASFDAEFNQRYREACRRMAETLKQLRKLAKRVVSVFFGALQKQSGDRRRTGAFFHVLKVDGRNLP